VTTLPPPCADDVTMQAETLNYIMLQKNVQYGTPDDGQRNCPKHVEFYYRINLDKNKKKSVEKL
jgi:hypothetical protein